MLGYPDLCQQFYSVLGSALSAFTGRFANCTMQIQSAINDTIPPALEHANPYIVEWGLQSVQAMAEFHMQYRCVFFYFFLFFFLAYFLFFFFVLLCKCVIFIFFVHFVKLHGQKNRNF